MKDSQPPSLCAPPQEFASASIKESGCADRLRSLSTRLRGVGSRDAPSTSAPNDQGLVAFREGNARLKSELASIANSWKKQGGAPDFRALSAPNYTSPLKLASVATLMSENARQPLRSLFEGRVPLPPQVSGGRVSPLAQPEGRLTVTEETPAAPDRTAYDSPESVPQDRDEGSLFATLPHSPDQVVPSGTDARSLRDHPASAPVQHLHDVKRYTASATPPVATDREATWSSIPINPDFASGFLTYDEMFHCTEEIKILKDQVHSLKRDFLRERQRATLANQLAKRMQAELDQREELLVNTDKQLQIMHQQVGELTKERYSLLDAVDGLRRREARAKSASNASPTETAVLAQKVGALFETIRRCIPIVVETQVEQPIFDGQQPSEIKDISSNLDQLRSFLEEVSKTHHESSMRVHPATIQKDFEGPSQSTTSPPPELQAELNSVRKLLDKAEESLKERDIQNEWLQLRVDRATTSAKHTRRQIDQLVMAIKERCAEQTSAVLQAAGIHDGDEVHTPRTTHSQLQADAHPEVEVDVLELQKENSRLRMDLHQMMAQIQRFATENAFLVALATEAGANTTSHDDTLEKRVLKLEEENRALREYQLANPTLIDISEPMLAPDDEVEAVSDAIQLQEAFSMRARCHSYRLALKALAGQNIRQACLISALQAECNSLQRSLELGANRPSLSPPPDDSLQKRLVDAEDKLSLQSTEIAALHSSRLDLLEQLSLLRAQFKELQEENDRLSVENSHRFIPVDDLTLKQAQGSETPQNTTFAPSVAEGTIEEGDARLQEAIQAARLLMHSANVRDADFLELSQALDRLSDLNKRLTQENNQYVLQIKQFQQQQAIPQDSLARMAKYLNEKTSLLANYLESAREYNRELAILKRYVKEAHESLLGGPDSTSGKASDAILKMVTRLLELVPFTCDALDTGSSITDTMTRFLPEGCVIPQHRAPGAEQPSQ
ncbi:hypothetical protein GMRT_13411 [Giardia muris]|uniref:Coiled-coil protein n=1 Tax=Giardia muris TaxID=5742 RepID=A0A4Z1T1G4_GIAMU|nr:hypothetical protein GMRT_13411 [Giardia muris]|eukprot:TNJ26379.1 hypothetical protein GMRT_13411 [Giardia muris]